MLIESSTDSMSLYRKVAGMLCAMAAGYIWLQVTVNLAREKLRKESKGRRRTLYDRIDGDRILAPAIDKFYEKVINDNHVNYFFGKS